MGRFLLLLLVLEGTERHSSISSKTAGNIRLCVFDTYHAMLSCVDPKPFAGHACLRLALTWRPLLIKTAHLRMSSSKGNGQAIFNFNAVSEHFTTTCHASWCLKLWLAWIRNRTIFHSCWWVHGKCFVSVSALKTHVSKAATFHLESWLLENF